jgi:2-polyprenyl-6-methoxyphenol hydroxylase-like FAD-dependent oxidoreductase
MIRHHCLAVLLLLSYNISAVQSFWGGKRLCSLKTNNGSAKTFDLMRSVVLSGGASLTTDTEWGRIGHDDDRPSRPQSTLALEGEEDDFIEIAIVGGGLAGLALAIGLSRANIPFRLYERAPELRSVSQGMLVVNVNGLRALRSIHPDLPDKILEAGKLMKSVGVTNIDANGNSTSFVRSTIDVEREKKHDGLAPVLIKWSTLQNVLASLLPSDVIVTGKSLADFVENENTPGGVTLTFHDGHCVRCEAMLGCDGTFSVVRQKMFQSDHGRPVSFGQLNWNAIIPTDSIPNQTTLDNMVSVTAYYGEPKWMAMINDCGGGSRFWQLRLMDLEASLKMSKSGGRGGLGLKGIKDSLIEVVSPSESISSAITATPESQIFERAIVGQTVVPTWRSKLGKVAIVGDAAHGVHPMAGQGANSAFESTSSLVEALVVCKRDWISGLESYEKQRKERADLVHKFCNILGCIQGNGVREEITEEHKNAMNEWILEGSPNDKPPKALKEAFEDFDVLIQPGVSRL